MNVFVVRFIDERLEQLRQMKQSLIDGLHDGRFAHMAADDLETLERMSVEPIDTAIQKLEQLRAEELAR
jgi:hypothetical protein